MRIPDLWIFQAVIEPHKVNRFRPEKIEQYVLQQGDDIQKRILDLAYLVQQTLHPDEAKMFSQVAENNPTRLGLWAKTIQNENDVLTKFYDWQKRGVFAAA